MCGLSGWLAFSTLKERCYILVRETLFMCSDKEVGLEGSDWQGSGNCCGKPVEEQLYWEAVDLNVSWGVWAEN